jgi:hypothetical protein
MVSCSCAGCHAGRPHELATYEWRATILLPSRHLIVSALVALACTSLSIASIADTPGGGVVYVDTNCAGPVHDGTSWTSAFSSISQGTNAAVAGQEVWVAQGNYAESVILKSGVALRGGYAASDGTRDIGAHTAVIGAVTTADSSTLDGFTVVASTTASITCSGTSPVIINNTISNQYPMGHCIYCSGATSAPIIDRNHFTKGDSAIDCDSAGAVVITNNIISTYSGLDCSYTPAIVENNLFNACSTAMSTSYCAAAISNNIATNCSVGLYADTRGAMPILSCNDFFANGQDYARPVSHPTDIHADPLFLNPEAGDFHIPFDSPCIDAGASSSAPNTDADGNPRPVDGNGDGVAAADIGPYEMTWGIAGISVTPSPRTTMIGNAGGPFSPSSLTYTVKNVNGSDVDWTVSNSGEWLSLSPTGGSLAPGQTATVTVSLNAAAASLPNGTYSSDVTFTDLTTGLGTTTRQVRLLVGAVYVNRGAVGTHDGRNWDTGFLTVSAGISAAWPGQEVWIAQGTYPEKDLLVSKNITVKGGFSGVGAVRDTSAYRTTVQSPQTASRVFLLTSPCTIDGLTISGDYCGIGVAYAPVVITGNTFTLSTTEGIYLSESLGAIISGNSFVGMPYGIDGYKSALTVADNTFTNCSRGMMFGSTGSAPKVFRNVIFGGMTGIDCSNSALEIANNLIVGCSSSGVRTDTTSGYVTNNTIVGCGTGAYCYPGPPKFSNNIVAYCTTGIKRSFSQTTMDLQRNDLYGNTTPYDPKTMAHAGDISVNPQFVNRSKNDYFLLPGSGCIDAGTSTGAPTDDLNGRVRARDGNGDGTTVVDIGCYEVPDHYMMTSGVKSLPNGARVGLTRITTTAAFTDRFYMESADRTFGIGVLGTASGPGRSVTVEGAVVTQDGETMIQSSLVTEGAHATPPTPLFMNPNGLGGGRLGMQSAVQDYRLVSHLDAGGGRYSVREVFTYGGANNIGLLVKAVGRVSAVGQGVFYLGGTALFDDGSEDVTGVAVAWPFGSDMMPPDDATIEIVGISSCTIKDGIVVRLLRPQSCDSVRVLKAPPDGPG